VRNARSLGGGSVLKWWARDEYINTAVCRDADDGFVDEMLAGARRQAEAGDCSWWSSRRVGEVAGDVVVRTGAVRCSADGEHAG
jgi:hypothetical protein